MKLVITGVSGYIGTNFVSHAQGRGHEFVSLDRRRPSSLACDWISYNLESDRVPILPQDTKVVLHLATSNNPNGQQYSEQEIRAAKLLISAALSRGAKFVFVSSQTARFDAPTLYGQTKWQIEQAVLDAGGWVVRPGQVYGGELRGLFGMLVKLVRRLPVLPLFVPAPQVQPIHVDDLSEGILRIAERDDLPSGVFCLAASEPVTFTRFLSEIAYSRLRIWRGFVPTPVWAIRVFALVLGKSFRSKLGMDRLYSLFDLSVMATAADLGQLGLALCPLRSGMHRSGNDRRRCLLQEGRALFIYVLKEPAGGTLLRRYVRAIEKLRDGKLLGLPRFYIRWPVLLAIVDRSNNCKTNFEQEFLWRLDSATTLAEATPLGSQRFLGSGERHGFAVSLFRIGSAMVSEISWRIICIIFSPVIYIVQTRVMKASSR